MALKFNAKESCLESNIVFVYDKFDAKSKKTGDPFYMVKAVCLNDNGNGTVAREFFCTPEIYAQVTESGYYEIQISVTGRVLAIKPQSFYQI